MASEQNTNSNNYNFDSYIGTGIFQPCCFGFQFSKSALIVYHLLSFIYVIANDLVV